MARILEGVAMSRLNMIRNLRIEHENILRHIREMEYLERCRMDAETAWGVFDRLSERLLEQKGNRDMIAFVSEKDVEAAEVYAIRKQQAYFQLYYKLNSDQCTCKPDSAIACDVCQALIKSKSSYREEI